MSWVVALPYYMRWPHDRIPRLCAKFGELVPHFDKISSRELCLIKLWKWSRCEPRVWKDVILKVWLKCSWDKLLKLINEPLQKVSGAETHHYPKLAACKSKGHIETFQLPFWFFQWTSFSDIDYNLDRHHKLDFTVVWTRKRWSMRKCWSSSHHAEFLELNFDWEFCSKSRKE
jgi:hypothetical protein